MWPTQRRGQAEHLPQAAEPHRIWEVVEPRRIWEVVEPHRIWEVVEPRRIWEAAELRRIWVAVEPRRIWAPFEVSLMVPQSGRVHSALPEEAESRAGLLRDLLRTRVWPDIPRPDRLRVVDPAATLSRRQGRTM